MAANGCPTKFDDKKKTENVNDNGNNTVAQPDLDEDLRRKVESLQIGDSKNQLESSNSSSQTTESKSYEDWKDELPIHLKSLKFMIGVLNDRNQQQPVEFSSENATQIPSSFNFGGPNKLQNMNILEDEIWEDSADRATEMVFKKRPVRLPFHPFSSALGRRPRMESARSSPRRRTKSAGPDLSSYRNETYSGPYGTRSYKHRDSDSALNSSSTAWFRKRRSVVDMNGVYVVEEISEEDEDIELEHRKRIGSADGSPDSLSVEMDLNVHQESILSPLRPIHRLRRDLWNISPISEDFSESDKEIEAIVENADNISTISSTNATFGDFSMSMSINSTPRLNCSSPILSHSPSLRMTPVTAALDTPPTSAGSGGSSVTKKIRDIARALDDISDKEEETTNTTTESEETDEEKTESFEIDLAAGGDTSVGGLNILNTSFTRDKSSSSLSDDVEKGDLRPKQNGNEQEVPKSFIKEGDAKPSTTTMTTC